jgi:hypothetical protein
MSVDTSHVVEVTGSSKVSICTLLQTAAFWVQAIALIRPPERL